MASIKMIAKDEATGKVKEIYEDIKSQFEIDFVPNLHKVMSSRPDCLEASWNKTTAVMNGPGKLDRLAKEIIAVVVSAVLRCKY
jgi:alkylhydroperoxidase family enzyme